MAAGQIAPGLIFPLRAKPDPAAARRESAYVQALFIARQAGVAERFEQRVTGCSKGEGES
jgi:hypothetical protein